VSDELDRLRRDNAALLETLEALRAENAALKERLRWPTSVREVPPVPEEYLDEPNPDAKGGA
jgi:hypothetical protein